MSNDEKLNSSTQSAGGCHRGYSVCLTDKDYKRVIDNAISKARAEVIDKIYLWANDNYFDLSELGLDDPDNLVIRKYELLQLLTKLSEGK